MLPKTPLIPTHINNQSQSILILPAANRNRRFRTRQHLKRVGAITSHVCKFTTGHIWFFENFASNNIRIGGK